MLSYEANSEVPLDDVKREGREAMEVTAYVVQ
jgi:hypothetical protein